MSDNNNFYSYRNKKKGKNVVPILYLDNGLTIYMNQANNKKFFYNNKENKENDDMVAINKFSKFVNKYKDENMEYNGYNNNYIDNKNEIEEEEVTQNQTEYNKLKKSLKNKQNYLLQFLTDIKGNHNVNIKFLEDNDELSDNDIKKLKNLNNINNIDIDNELDLMDEMGEMGEEEEEDITCPEFPKRKCYLGYNVLYYNEKNLGNKCPYIMCNERILINYGLYIILFLIIVVILYFIFDNFKN